MEYVLCRVGDNSLVFGALLAHDYIENNYFSQYLDGLDYIHDYSSFTVKYREHKIHNKTNNIDQVGHKALKTGMNWLFWKKGRNTFEIQVKSKEQVWNNGLNMWKRSEVEKTLMDLNDTLKLSNK